MGMIRDIDGHVIADIDSLSPTVISSEQPTGSTVVSGRTVAQGEAAETQQAVSWEQPVAAHGLGSSVQFVARRVTVAAIAESIDGDHNSTLFVADDVDNGDSSERLYTRRRSYPTNVGIGFANRSRSMVPHEELLLSASDDKEVAELSVLELHRVRSKLKKVKRELVRYQKTELPVVLQRALLAERTSDSTHQELEQTRAVVKEAEVAAAETREQLEVEKAELKESMSWLTEAAQQEREELVAMQTQLREELEVAEKEAREAHDAREELERSVETHAGLSRQLDATAWENSQLKKTIDKRTKRLSQAESSVLESQKRRQREWVFSPLMMKAIGGLLCSLGSLGSLAWLWSGFWGVALVVLLALAIWGVLTLALLTCSFQSAPEDLIGENVAQLRRWMLGEQQPTSSSRKLRRWQQQREGGELSEYLFSDDVVFLDGGQTDYDSDSYFAAGSGSTQGHYSPSTLSDSVRHRAGRGASRNPLTRYARHAVSHDTAFDVGSAQHLLSSTHGL